MPLYEYLCHKCGKKFDALQKFSDEPLKIHEEDGGELERLISSPAFHFKGTGWYVTDYAKSNGVSTPAGEGSKSTGDSGEKSGEKSSDKSGESKSGESKSESKPAETKTESAPKPAPAASSSSSSDK